MWPVAVIFLIGDTTCFFDSVGLKEGLLFPCFLYGIRDYAVELMEVVGRCTKLVPKWLRLSAPRGDKRAGSKVFVSWQIILELEQCCFSNMIPVHD